MAKIFFTDNIEWSSKNLWKMKSADVKANKNKKSGGSILQIFKDVPNFKTWNTIWKEHVFFIWF